MLVKKLMVSGLAAGLLWAAGFARQAAVANRPGLLLLAGQFRLSLGDQEGGLRLMKQAAEQDQASAPVKAPAAANAARVTSTKCLPNTGVRRVSSPAAHPGRLVMVAGKPLPPDFARQMARRERDLVRLSLDQARMGEQLRVLVLQHVRDLPQPPAAPLEPQRANP